jgi:hypothetical protein
MRRLAWLRTLTLALAVLHAFPAKAHLAAFFATPSWTDGWKGFGALCAIALYLLPPTYQARGLHFLWSRHPSALRVAGFVLAVAHAFPATDHLPRFFAAGAFGDAWRGAGAAIAIVWFLLPLRVQGRCLGSLARLSLLPMALAPSFRSDSLRSSLRKV